MAYHRKYLFCHVSCCDVLSKTMDCLILEDGTCMLSRNIANKLPTYATQHPSGAMRTQTLWSLASLSSQLAWLTVWRLGYDHEAHSKLTLMNDIINLSLKEAMKVFVKYMSWSITDSPVCNCLDRNFSHPVCKLWSCLIWNLAGCKFKTFHNTKWRIQINKLFTM